MSASPACYIQTIAVFHFVACKSAGLCSKQHGFVCWFSATPSDYQYSCDCKPVQKTAGIALIAGCKDP